MASISLKNIKKVYPGDVEVIPDLNLEIRDKEFIILVGPSGCGKSTTLRMIAGLEEISGGELYIGDKLVNDIAPKDRDIAMVFQNYALYPHMSVYKNMAFGLSLRKMDKGAIDAKVKEAAKTLELDQLLQRKPKALSGGQRQRVALGRAMVRDPAVFLLDEPLSNLDAKLRTQMRTEITKLHKSLQTTFVYVTHDQTEAMTMGDRIVVMKDGIIQQTDTPQNLYDYPCNLFVAGFIGSPQMNFIPATLGGAVGRYTLDFGSYHIPVPQGGGDDRLAPLVGREVVLGIRPEDLLTADSDTPPGQPDQVIQVTVDLAEPMGAEVYLYGDCAGNRLIIRAPGRTPARSGDKIALTVDNTKLHIFDKSTEKAVYNLSMDGGI